MQEQKQKNLDSKEDQAFNIQCRQSREKIKINKQNPGVQYQNMASKKDASHEAHKHVEQTIREQLSINQQNQNQEEPYQSKIKIPNFEAQYQSNHYLKEQQMRYERFLQYQRQRYQIQMRMRQGPSFNSYSILQSANKQEQMLSQQEQEVQTKDRYRKSNRKYLRSTNNSHKKYLTILKRLFFSVMSPDQITQFQQVYGKYKCSRTYFFIILVYMKYKFSKKLRQIIRNNFIEEMKDKIKTYQGQIQKRKDERFKNYRRQEVYQISFSVKAIKEFYNGSVQKAIEMIYKKNKQIIIKKALYDHTISFIQELEKQLKLNPGHIIEKPYSQEREEQLKENNIGFIFPPPKDKIDPLTAKKQEEQEQQGQIDMQDEIQKILMNNQEDEFANQSNPQDVQIYPPIPPSFYLPQFSSKYSRLFRMAKNMKTWAEIGKNIQRKNRQLQAQNN